MADRVRPLKNERLGPGEGSEDDLGFPTQANPEEDQLAAHGIVAGETGKDGSDLLVRLYREDDKWYFEDVDNAGPSGRKSLAELAATASGTTDELVKVSANDTTAGYLSSKIVAGSGIVVTEQNDGGNETLEVTVSGLTTGSFKYQQIIWAEENAALGNGQREWSFGNGATGNIGMPVFTDAEIVGLVYNADTAGDATTEVEVHVNGSSVGASIVPGNGVESATASFSPVAVSAGDLIGFFTITAGGASDVRIGAVLEYSIAINGFEGPQGPPGTSSIEVADEGTNVTGSPFDRLDFVGKLVTASNAGSGTSQITVSFPSHSVSTSLSRSTTSSNSYQDKVTLVTPATTGTFVLHWSAIVDSEGVADVRSRNVTDGSTITDMQFKPTDSSEDERCFSGFSEVSLTGSSKTISLQWRGNGDLSGIQSARLRLEEVA